MASWLDVSKVDITEEHIKSRWVLIQLENTFRIIRDYIEVHEYPTLTDEAKENLNILSGMKLIISDLIGKINTLHRKLDYERATISSDPLK